MLCFCNLRCTRLVHAGAAGDIRCACSPWCFYLCPSCFLRKERRGRRSGGPGKPASQCSRASCTERCCAQSKHGSMSLTCTLYFSSMQHANIPYSIITRQTLPDLSLLLKPMLLLKPRLLLKQRLLLKPSLLLQPSPTRCSACRCRCRLRSPNLKHCVLYAISNGFC